MPHKQLVKLEVTMLGWSSEAISEGSDGYCWFPLGEVDPSFKGGRKPVRIRVHATEDIRQNYEVIVTDEELNVKEHTPVELAYQSAAGPYQRVTESHPLPEVPYFEDAAGTITKVTEPTPLPVTMGHPSNRVTAPPLIATALGTTQIVAAPGAGNKIVVHYFSMGNFHALAVDVALTFDATGAAANLRHRQPLAATGGNVNANLTDCVYELGDNQPLFAWLAAAYVGGVVFNIVYSIQPV